MLVVLNDHRKEALASFLTLPATAAARHLSHLKRGPLREQHLAVDVQERNRARIATPRDEPAG
jgi:hypothetical protein